MEYGDFLTNFFGDTTPSIVDSTTTNDGLSIIANFAAAADPWYFNTNRTMRTPAACRMAKSCQVKPAVNNFLRGRSIKAQAAVLHAVADHSSMAAACELARISSSKEQAAQRFVCEKSAQLMKRNCMQK